MINKDSKILITGGSGLVGQNLTNRLYKEGYTNIRVNLHKRGVRTPIEGVEYVHFDLKTYLGFLRETFFSSKYLHSYDHNLRIQSFTNILGAHHGSIVANTQNLFLFPVS